MFARDHCEIDKELYEKFGVKRGLRDKEGVGVLAGLTNISNIQSSKIVDGKKVPCEGQLFYRGYNIYDLVKGFLSPGPIRLRGSNVSFIVRHSAGSAAVSGISGNFSIRDDASEKFYKRCYFKSAK